MKSRAEAMLAALVVYLLLMYFIVPVVAVVVYTIKGGEWIAKGEYYRLVGWQWEHLP